MARRLSIQSLEDRRLLAAQPVLADVGALAAAQLESRLIQSDVPANIAAVAAHGNLQLTRATDVPASNVSRDGIDPVAVSESMLGVLPDAAFRSEALASIALDVTQNLHSVRPMIQSAIDSPASSDARREFLELMDELVDDVIGRFDAEEVSDEPIANVANISPEAADAIRSLVLDRLVVVQSTIESRLQSQASAGLGGSVSDRQPVETESTVDEARYQLTLSDGTGETTPLDSSAMIGHGIPEGEINHVSHVADSAEVVPLQLLSPSVFANSQTVFLEDAMHTLRGALDALLICEFQIEAGSQTTRLAPFKLGDLVGGVASLDLLSALDATTSDLLETVEEVRPRIDIRLAAFISTLTIGYVLRIRIRGAREREEEFDEEGETLKLAGGVARPSFGV